MAVAAVATLLARARSSQLSVGQNADLKKNRGITGFSGTRGRN